MVEKIVLSNGVRILCEKIPYVRSASCGIWVESGSRHEPAAMSGASHFIEHMTFKGTERRSALDIAMEMDTIGGQANAFTTKENTCFYLKALDIHLEAGIDVLCDMFFDSRFSEEDVQTERGVILEEIGMYEDSPEDLAAERLTTAVFRGSPLARPVLGKKQTVERMTGEELRAYRDAHYRPEGTVVSLSGSFPDHIPGLLCRIFSRMKPAPALRMKPAVYRPAKVSKEKKLEQNHLVFAFPGVKQTDPLRYEVRLMTSALGGGMSSRLFQEVREKQGLCYSIYSSSTSFEDVGMITVETAVNREVETEATELILSEIARFAREGIGEEELLRVREQMKASILMGLESTSSRMSHIARSEMLFGRQIEPDELLAGYDGVTRESLNTLARKLLDPAEMSVSTVGRIRKAAREK